MKRVRLLFAVLVTISIVPVGAQAWQILPSLKCCIPSCCNRDADCTDAMFPAPCVFPPVPSPCAVPCRPPGLQPQAVPCAFETACPSLPLPCHGVSYARNPYVIFR